MYLSYNLNIKYVFSYFNIITNTSPPFILIYLGEGLKGSGSLCLVNYNYNYCDYQKTGCALEDFAIYRHAWHCLADQSPFKLKYSRVYSSD